MFFSHHLHLLTLFISPSLSHLVITYPGWRGNNLHTNGTLKNGKILPGSIGVNWNASSQSYTFPYGQQWIYPCGGMPTSQNRTKWPVMGGGAIAFQPGWYTGHSRALIYINMGIGNEPLNYSLPIVPLFELVGPSNEMYNSSVCLPQVPLPNNYTPHVGDNATIQIIETAQHGAALYTCVDITFANPSDVENVSGTNCYNSTGPYDRVDFRLIFATHSLNKVARLIASPPPLWLIMGLWLLRYVL